MIKAVLFDLDGTLLPMEQDSFLKAYFGGISARLAARGYNPDELIPAIWRGTAAMIKNDGSRTNEQAFWDTFATIYGEEARADEPYFEQYYLEDFPKVQKVCGFAPEAREVVELLHSRGVRTVLATNPIFPAVATRERMRWAGLSDEDFELVTTYENIGLCKPNPEYFREIAKRIGVSPEECLMVGNDVSDDTPAEKVGMRVFLLTRDLINKEERDISTYPHGDFSDLVSYINTLI